MDNKEIRALYGGHNDFPPNWKEIDQQQFWKRWFMYSWDAEEWRQMHSPPDTLAKFYDVIAHPIHRRSIVVARLFIYSDKTGLAITQGWDGRTYNPRFFEFGVCMHIDKSEVPEKSHMCYHVSKCNNCGMEFHVDSSD
jgi:hypothetical protein